MPTGPDGHERYRDAMLHRVGEYSADYGEIPAEQLGETVPEMDEFLRRSRAVSEKRGL